LFEVCQTVSVDEGGKDKRYLMIYINAIQQVQATVVSIQGSIDAMTASQVTNFLTMHIEGSEVNLVVDLEQVEFMSSAGLRAILTILKESRQHGGDLRLAAAHPGVEKILKMSGFTNILKSYKTVDEAVQSFNP
jgi:anti-sigma B factor antagonist